MRWWGWTVLGVAVLVLVGLFVWPGWVRGGASKVAEGDKPKVETATPAPAPAASDKKDEAPEKKTDEKVDMTGQCEALRAACEESTPGDARCETLQAQCEQVLASCPECPKAGGPDEVAKCLANCKKQCEDKVAKAKPKKSKAKAPLATAGGSAPASSPAPKPHSGSVVWWTTGLDGSVHQWK